MISDKTMAGIGGEDSLFVGLRKHVDRIEKALNSAQKQWQQSCALDAEHTHQRNQLKKMLLKVFAIIENPNFKPEDVQSLAQEWLEFKKQNNWI